MQIEILKKLDSQYVVKYIDSIVTEKYLIIIMEYCESRCWVTQMGI